METYRPKKIMSGGQTGADRAGLDVAIRLGMSHGGWCPAGRRAEGGPIPACYQLTETQSASYVSRTNRNIRDSDGTVVFTFEEELSGGTKRTALVALGKKKPCLVLRPTGNPVATLAAWLEAVRPETLNIAGSTESKSPGIHAFAVTTLEAVWTRAK